MNVVKTNDLAFFFESCEKRVPRELFLKIPVVVRDNVELQGGADTLDYERYKSANYFDYGQHSRIFRSLDEITGGIERSKDKSVALLGQAIR